MRYLAIDIGGTKTRLALFNKTGPAETLPETYEYPTNQNYPVALTELSSEVRNAIGKEVAGIAVGLPGIVNRELGIIKGCAPNLEGWVGHSLGNDLRQELGLDTERPLIIENDANLGALGEERARKESDRSKSMLYVAIGTGIGAGHVVNGKLSETTIDSEIGEIRFPLQTGGTVSWEGLAARDILLPLINAGNTAEVARRIALGLVAATALYNPLDQICIGGSIGAEFRSYKTALRATMHTYTKGIGQTPELFEACLGPDSVLFGGLALLRHSNFVTES